VRFIIQEVIVQHKVVKNENNERTTTKTSSGALPMVPDVTQNCRKRICPYGISPCN